MKKTLIAAAVALSTLATLPAHAGMKMNGISINGISINGIQINGLKANGFVVNGIKRNGMRTSGSETRSTGEGGTLNVRAVTLADGTVVVLN